MFASCGKTSQTVSAPFGPQIGLTAGMCQWLCMILPKLCQLTSGGNLSSHDVVWSSGALICFAEQVPSAAKRSPKAKSQDRLLQGTNREQPVGLGMFGVT